jgi:hypothetical protein
MTRLILACFLLDVAVPLAAQQPKLQTAGRPTRIMARGEWQVVRTIGLDSDLFEHPIGLASRGHRLVVLDAGDLRVKSIFASGTVEWKAGGRGRGPGEMIAPLSVTVDAAGNTIVYDAANARITSINSRGKPAFVAPLSIRTDRAMPGPAPDKVLLLNTASDTLAVIADTSGGLRVGSRLPAEFRAAVGLPLEMSGIVAGTDAHLVSFRWSSRMWMVSTRGTIVRTCIGVDSLGFPGIRESVLNVGTMKARTRRIDPTARQASAGIAILGGLTVVLKPESKTGPAMLDLYRPECGAYVESRPFPYVSRHIAGVGSELAVLAMEPVPHIAIVRWVKK